MFTNLHPVLIRQLTKSGYKEQDLRDSESLHTLILKISRSYEDADKLRYLKERALELSSHEMQELYNTITNEKDELEKLVNELTEKDKTLTKTNDQLLNEISEREKAEKSVGDLNKQLIVAARRAGMADIATSTLHNIGNILNSINTSIAMIAERLNASEINTLAELGNLLKQHEHDAVNFILKDPKGKNIPKFLPVLLSAAISEKEAISTEIAELGKNVEHIRDIITVQQSLNTAIGMTEEVSMDELIEDSLKLARANYSKAGINIVRSFEPIKKVMIDKVKLLQVVVNLVKNAIDSLLESKSDDKKLILCIKERDSCNFIVEVIDNGLGILSENMINIFSHGYTTKKNGHGFGLHSSANAVHELGGKLQAESDGVGKGAKFILTLPYNLEAKKESSNV